MWLRYLATVLAIGTECGVALLTVNDDEFRDGVQAGGIWRFAHTQRCCYSCRLPNQIWCNPRHKRCYITHGGVALCSRFSRASWSSDRGRFSTFCRKLVMRKSHLKLVFCISKVISHFATVLCLPKLRKFLMITFSSWVGVVGYPRFGKKQRFELVFYALIGGFHKKSEGRTVSSWCWKEAAGSVWRIF